MYNPIYRRYLQIQLIKESQNFMLDKPQDDENNSSDTNDNSDQSLDCNNIKFESTPKDSIGKQILKSFVVISMIGLFAGGVYLQNQQIKEKQETSPEKNSAKNSDSPKLTYVVPPADAYSWTKSNYIKSKTLFARVPSLKGFYRPILATDSFANWLRFLPVKSKCYNMFGKHCNTLAINIPEVLCGHHNLHLEDFLQTYRLIAEYKFSHNQDQSITLPTKYGYNFSWLQFSKGQTLKTLNDSSKEIIKKTRKSDKSYNKFINYFGHVSLNIDKGKWISSNFTEVKNDYPKVGDLLVFQTKKEPLKNSRVAIIVDLCVNKKTKQTAILIAGISDGLKLLHLLSNPDSQLSPWFVMKTFKPFRTSDYLYNTCYRLKKSN